MRGSPPGRWPILAAAQLAACTASTEIITPPPPPASAFSVHFVADSGDQATATALGWTTGLPGMAVTVTPVDSSSAPRTLTGEADGTVTIPDLAAGLYLVEATRWLTSAERGTLPAADDGQGFVIRTVLRAAQGAELTVPVPASRRRGIVIRQWAFNVQTAPGIGGYPYGGFLELYNQADTTIYLDGLVVAEGFHVDYDYPLSPCSVSLPFREDPAGAWSRFLQKFPGSGRDYPAQPGQRIVIATDAIDHGSLVPDGLDLTRADFEFAGSADADNPAVPNMVDVGVISYPSGHGLIFAGLGLVTVLTRPLEVASLLRSTSIFGEYVRIPRAAILDAISIQSNYPGASFPPCSRLLPPILDRRWSEARGTDELQEYRFSLSRRPAAVTAGLPRLWWTKDSYSDFERTIRNPNLAP